VGVIWMCNPGSAMWPPQVAPWGQIQGDPTLWRVLSLYKAAVGGRQSSVQQDDYILVLNCFYSVGPDPDAAFDEWRKSGCAHHENIPSSAVFVVVAWGADKPYGPVTKSINEIEKHRTDPSLITDPPFLVVYVDPTLTDGTSTISDDLTQMHYPSHPGSPVFASTMNELAAALKGHILGSCAEEGVMGLDE
jgi:hypothetical protein